MQGQREISRNCSRGGPRIGGGSPETPGGLPRWPLPSSPARRGRPGPGRLAELFRGSSASASRPRPGIA
eukprot:10044843-Alexandrium_andersonii.AAC.1